MGSPWPLHRGAWKAEGRVRVMYGSSPAGDVPGPGSAGADTRCKVAVTLRHPGSAGADTLCGLSPDLSIVCGRSERVHRVFGLGFPFHPYRGRT